MIRPPPRSTLFPYTTLFRLCGASTGGGPRGLVQIRFPLAKALHLSQPVQHHRGGDGMQPGGEFRLAPKRAQPIERADERVLGELTRQLVVSRQAVGQPVDTIHVGVVQRALRGAVPGPDFGYQFAFVHQAPSGQQGAASVNSVTRRSVGGLRGAGGRGGYACFKRIRIPTPTSTASRKEARVPTRKYSANSRSSSCLKRASDLAAMIHPTAAYSPSNTMVSARARSRDPTARPRATRSEERRV